MRKLWSFIKRFLRPSASAPLYLRILPLFVGGILMLFVVYGSIQAWTYTNSSEFCGTTCHTMPPEYNAYLRSPHARVQCVECHIGRDIVTTQFTRKAGDLRHVVFTITQKYEFPIRSRAMRPARDSCEKCHFPEKFSDDSLREVSHFADDEMNSETSTFLIMKTGGGTEREGLGKGIHWHIENEVFYLATDELEQEIPYVRVIEKDGSVTEYYDVSSGITPQDVAGTTLEKMDCITCHNRVTHTIPNPADAVDQALSKQLLPSDLPFIRQQAVELIGRLYLSREEASDAFASLEEFYAENHPQIHAEQGGAIRQAVSTLQDMYDEIVFSEQKIDWQTHRNNLEHKDFPGCFRCHGGSHLTGTEEAIRLECNLCHSIPVVTDETGLVTNIELSRGPEPTSHTHTSWITIHGLALDNSCAACHPPKDPSIDYMELEGKPPADGSFCGNSACHVSEWQFAKFNSPALHNMLERQLYLLQNTSPFLLEGVPRTYESTFKAMFDGRCTACHAGPNAEADLDLSNYASLFHETGDGPAIVAGDPDGSLLVQRQSQRRDHFGQVLETELEALREWILAGAPER
jgi:nitrate/TMAO reductase-like tetraheme cytochrome c subunit